MNDIIEALERTGALIKNTHVVMTSGKHSNTYITKDKLYPHTAEVVAITRLFAEHYKDTDIDVVVGPALGGIILAQWTAYHLSELKGKEVLATYTEKDAENNQVLTRGYDALVAGKRILVTEDTTSTGMSAKKVVNAIQGAGGNVVGVIVMVNRNPKEVTSEFMGVPFVALVDLEAEAYEESACPLCEQNVPINTTVGHGKKFLQKHGGGKI